jgi:hypothetical protein
MFVLSQERSWLLVDSAVKQVLRDKFIRCSVVGQKWKRRTSYTAFSLAKPAVAKFGSYERAFVIICLSPPLSNRRGVQFSDLVPLSQTTLVCQTLLSATRVAAPTQTTSELRRDWVRDTTSFGCTATHFYRRRERV